MNKSLDWSKYTPLYGFATLDTGEKIKEHFKIFTQDELDTLLKDCSIEYFAAVPLGCFNLVIGIFGKPKEEHDIMDRLKEQINSGAYCNATERDQDYELVVFTVIDTYKVFPTEKKTK